MDKRIKKIKENQKSKCFCLSTKTPPPGSAGKARPAAARARAQGPQTREARGGSGRERNLLRALSRSGAEPDSELKFQGAGRIGVSALKGMVFVWGVSSWIQVWEGDE